MKIRAQLTTHILLGLSAALLAACAAPSVDRFPATVGESIPNSQAQLLVPAGPGPFPAVVVLHTCGGIGGHLNIWAFNLEREGYVVLKVDSFGPRGVKRICGTWQVSVDEVAADAIAAAEHLRRLPFVDRNRIYAIGFSYGAMAGLRLASASYLRRQVPPVPFRAIVAFYPYCLADVGAPPAAAARGNNFYSDIATPLHLLLGQADTEAPSGRCAAHADGLRKAGQPVSYAMFPGVTHAFDQHSPQLGYRYDQPAIDTSMQEMLEFFRRN